MVKSIEKSALLILIQQQGIKAGGLKEKESR
jgi:hypothetical protein